MGKFEDVLELIKVGVINECEIVERFGFLFKEVEDIIKIFESFGYVEKVEFGLKVCEICFLKKVCYGLCLRFIGVKVFKLIEKVFFLER